MRPRDLRVHLHDMDAAARTIAEFISARSLDDYRSDLMLRSAVERQFEILGEALRRALNADPSLAKRIPAARGVVDFRNVIAHGCDILSPTTVWDIARNELPKLAVDVVAELRRLDN